MSASRTASRANQQQISPEVVKKKWIKIFHHNIQQNEEYYFAHLRPTFQFITASLESSQKHSKNVSDITSSSGGESRYFPAPIKQFIREQIQSYTECEVQANLLGENGTTMQIRVSMQFYHPFDVEMAMTRDIQQKMESYAKNVMCWILFIRPYAQTSCARTLTLTVFLTKLKKEMPESEGLILSAEHVNTGFTDVCVAGMSVDQETNRNKIIIYRKEEWFKVFIHETFHRFGLDFSGASNGRREGEDRKGEGINACLDDVFRYVAPHKYNVYEAYCEFWARWIHTLFCTYWKLERMGGKNASRNARFYLDSVYALLEKEQKFSCDKMVQVLNYVSGIRYGDLFMDFNSVENEMKRRYKEDTNVMSYYIITCILFCNCGRFLSWCAYEGGTTNGIAFRNAIDNYRFFCGIIGELSHDASFLKMVQQSEIRNRRRNNRQAAAAAAAVATTDESQAQVQEQQAQNSATGGLSSLSLKMTTN